MPHYQLMIKYVYGVMRLRKFGAPRSMTVFMKPYASTPPGPPEPAIPIEFSSLLLNGGSVTGSLPLSCDCRSLMSWAKSLSHFSVLQKLKIGHTITSAVARLSTAAVHALTLPPKDMPQILIRARSTLGSAATYVKISIDHQASVPRIQSRDRRTYLTNPRLAAVDQFDF